MTPKTDIRISFQLATVQLKASELTEADLRAPAAEFARLTHANERCREDKMFVHKARCKVEDKEGAGVEGMMQSALFDADKSTGKQELKELMDAIKETAVEHLYPQEERRIIGE